MFENITFGHVRYLATYFFPVCRCCDLRSVQLAPFISLQVKTIKLLMERDTMQIFAEPVNLEEVSSQILIQLKSCGFQMTAD